eukprot:scaffold1906_cov403-Prasinococcus_capsulatus_cf.AAC.5
MFTFSVTSSRKKDKSQEVSHHRNRREQNEEDVVVPKFSAFPYQPYQIQEELMRNIYLTLEHSKVGILESPTGTGKTLSVICSTLEWLRQHRSRESHEWARKDGDACGADDDEPGWLRTYSREGVAKKEKRERFERNLAKVLSHQIESVDQAALRRRARALQNSKKSADPEDDAEFDLDDVDEDKENLFKRKARDYSTDEDSECEEGDAPVKIFFCSRTHSQLSQVLHEMRKTEFEKEVRAVCVASRKILCVNDKVKNLTAARMNEACLDLQQKSGSKAGEKGKKGCPFLKGAKQLRSQVLQRQMDIEELAQSGASTCACPYYAVRDSILWADLILLPYNALLHEPTRQSLGVSLKDNVVIFDEAHNLIDAVNSSHSANVTRQELEGAQQQLQAYLERYSNRLAASNLRNVRMFSKLATSLKKFLDAATQPTMMTVNDFLIAIDSDNINLFKLERYIRLSKLVFKCSDFWDKSNEEGKVHNTVNHYGTGALHALSTLFSALTHEDKDGRILIQPTTGDEIGFFKYVLLNAARHFSTVVDEARSVLLVGGTLQPWEELTTQLFPHVPSDRMLQFSCDHIVPKQNILALAVPAGPSGRRINLSYQNRSREDVKLELGRFLLNVCRVVPDGVVCFFPSFEYEKELRECWKRSGLLSQIASRKPILMEPKHASDVEDVLQKHSENPGLILCVVSGKLSEGINFSDRLGRCVVMFGLPYANRESPELKERMRFLGEKRAARFYQNICFQAINQSIGRAIRHRGDYATILLVDERYTSAENQQSLPGWIRKSLSSVNNVGQVQMALSSFFRSRTPTASDSIAHAQQ